MRRPEFRHAIAFPDDARLVISLLEGTLNRVTCDVCRLEVTVDVPLACTWPEKAIILIWGLDRASLIAALETADEASLEAFDVRAPATWGAFQAEVRELATSFLQDANSRASADGPEVRNVDGRLPYEHPFVLLAFSAQLAGTIPIPAPPDRLEEARDLLRGFLDEIAQGLLRRLYKEAFHGAGLHSFPALVVEHVPPEALTPYTLDALSRARPVPSPDLLSDPHRVDATFRSLYIHAVACHVAGVANPLVEEWVGIVLYLFRLSLLPNVTVPDAFFLIPEVYAKLASFDRVWNGVMKVLRPKDPELWPGTDGWKAAEKAFALFDMDAEFHAAVRQGVFSLDVTNVRISADVLATVYHDTKGADDDDFVSEAAAVAFATTAGKFFDADQGEVALEAFGLIADAAEVAGNWHGLVVLCSKVVEVLNDRRLPLKAAAIVRDYEDILIQNGSAIPPTAMQAWLVEVGNTLRYCGAPKPALDVYFRARKLFQLMEEPSPQKRRVITRNIAIVQRVLGRYFEAIRMFEESLETLGPHDHLERAHLHLSLAVTWSAVNTPRRALDHALAGMTHPLAEIDAFLAAGLLLAAASARARVTPGQPIPELPAFMGVVERTPSYSIQVASALLDIDGYTPIDEEQRRWATTTLEAALRVEGRQMDGSSRATAGVVLAHWRLARGDDSGAREALSLTLAELPQASLPWQLHHLMARLSTDPAEKWAAIQAALSRLEEDGPQGDDLSIRTSWMADKTMFQDDAIRTSKMAWRAGLAETSDLLAVLEFCTAREIVAVRRGSDGDIIAELRRLAGGAAPAYVVAFLQDAESVDVLSFPLHRPDPPRVGPGLQTSDVVRGARRFVDEVQEVSPERAALLDAHLADLLARVGTVIQELVPAGVHICFVPCPALFGVPLHAAILADGSPVITRNTVSVTPNLATLADVMVPSTPTKPAGLFAVGKRGDRPAFTERVAAAADQIKGRLHLADAAVVLGPDASRERCLEVLEGWDHAVFLCHGVDGGPARGTGLCVSDGEALPPGMLPVDEVAALRRFVVDAVDMEPIASTPLLWVSMACSSGRARHGDGGVRVGMERALFAHGTRTMLAPLWNVDHDSALAFLETFYEHATCTESVSVAQAYQAACLKSRARTPDLFRWAPFTLTGNWTGAVT